MPQGPWHIRDAQALLPGTVEKSGSAGTKERMEQMFSEVVVQAGPAPAIRRVSIGRGASESENQQLR